jgi:protein SCO1
VAIARALILTMLASALAAGCDRAGPRTPPSPFKSIDISSVEWGRDFHLTDHSGKPRSLADFKGRVVMLFFGYTHCPDACPTTLAAMAQVRARLGADAQRVQGLFVTVDPKRDTPQVLAQYVPAFDASFLGLYGDQTSTAALAREFKIYYAAQQADAQGNYTVDHSAGVFVFDRKGRLRLMMRPGSTVDAMTADVAQLLKE